MSGAEIGVAEERGRLDRLVESGWFETIPSGLLLVLSGIAGRLHNQPVGVFLLDAALYITTALTAWFPRVAGVALGGCLALLLVVPVEWATLGEYAAPIAVLGAGMRRRAKTQLVMMIGYGALLVAVTAREAPTQSAIILGSLAWVFLMTVAWSVGYAFVRSAEQQERLRAAEIVLQRQQLTYELHDTVARSLTMAAKLAERRLSRQAEPDPELESIVAAVREADERLRMTMSLLHDEEGSAVPIGPSSLADAVRAGQTLLQEHGFRAEISIQGDLGRLSAEQSTLLGAAAGEAFANLVKHGDPARPCAVVVAVTRQQAELTLLNHPRTGESPTSSDDSFGLLAMRRRMTEAGGTASAEKVGEQWRVRIQLPLRADDGRG